MLRLSLRPLLICGPSGSGKSTLLKRLLEQYPDKFGFTVSHTMRRPRLGEVDGLHYHFTTEENMLRDIKEGKFIEHAFFSGNHYGTSYEAIEAVEKQGKIVLLDIDVEGVKQIKKTTLNPWSVFIRPPSLEVLKQRLIKRKTESEDTLRMRLNKAEEEIKYGTTPGNFDAIIVNDDLDRAYKELKDFVTEKVLKQTKRI